MRTLLDATFILILFVLIRTADLAISAALGRSYIRAVCYGFVAILALLWVILKLFGL